METPRFQHQAELKNLQYKLQELQKSVPEEISYRNNAQEYYLAMIQHQEEKDVLQEKIKELQSKEMVRTPSQNAANLDIRNGGFGLN